MTRDPLVRALVLVALTIASIYLLGLLWQILQQFADILLLFFFAWLLAFVLEPIVVVLNQRGRVPRYLAIGVTYLTLLVLLSLGVLLLVPALSAQAVEIVRNLPGYAEQVTAWAVAVQSDVNSWLTSHGSPVLLDVRSALNPDEIARRTEALGPPVLSNFLSLATGLATILAEIVILVILSFYFMADGANVAERLIRVLPLRAQDDTRFLISSIHNAFAGFLRGQLIQALTGGIGTGLIMSALHVDFALLTSVTCGVVLLVPFIGPFLAVVLPVAIAAFTAPSAVLILLIALFILQQGIFNVLAPRIMSQQVGLHPLLVFFAVLMGARLAGAWGAIFGVPVVAVALRMASFYRAGEEERAARLQQQLPGQALVSVAAEVAAPGPRAAGTPAPAPAPGDVSDPLASPPPPNPAFAERNIAARE